ncbi:transposase domain-containing protein [Pseudomonas sp. Ap32]|nr:transposase domain-containing protein [Pseudomonas sp. Ap32]
MNRHDPYAYLKDVLTWLPTRTGQRREDVSSEGRNLAGPGRGL